MSINQCKAGYSISWAGLWLAAIIVLLNLHSQIAHYIAIPCVIAMMWCIASFIDMIDLS